jgi:SAM-dependent methyltransferase
MERAFPPEAFDRADESSDLDFYAQPRLVNHIDDYAIAAVGEAYRRFLPTGGDFLDLMSSWVSHYPDDLARNRLVGHGMNLVELAHNPALTEYWVQDLNAEPTLPRGDSEFDGVTICVSVQYLTRPVEVFAEIARVLKPGCPLVVAFSNRCFPTKAVAAWRYLDDQGHAELVAAYMKATGAFEPAKVIDLSPRVTMIGVPEDAALRERIRSGIVQTDPLFVVHARRLPANGPSS